jgi:hypothetical protein
VAAAIKPLTFRGTPAMVQLSDTQSILLARAAQREDGSLYPLPSSLEGKADTVTKALRPLLKRGFSIEREGAVSLTRTALHMMHVGL